MGKNRVNPFRCKECEIEGAGYQQAHPVCVQRFLAERGENAWNAWNAWNRMGTAFMVADDNDNLPSALIIGRNLPIDREDWYGLQSTALLWFAQARGSEWEENYEATVSMSMGVYDQRLVNKCGLLRSKGAPLATLFFTGVFARMPALCRVAERWGANVDDCLRSLKFNQYVAALNFEGIYGRVTNHWSYEGSPAKFLTNLGDMYGVRLKVVNAEIYPLTERAKRTRAIQRHTIGKARPKLSHV